MINLGRLTLSSHFAKPKSFILLRNEGVWLNGRFVTNQYELEGTGVIVSLSSKEIAMLPEGDAIKGSIKIYTKMPVYTTRVIDDNGHISDEIKFHSEFYKVILVKDYVDFGYNHVIAVRKLGA